MNLKKVIAISITAILLGLIIIPVQGAIQQDNQRFPIQLSIVNTDGSIGTKLLSLTQAQAIELSDIVEKFSYRSDRVGLMDALEKFFRRTGYNDGAIFMKGMKGNLFNILPGCPIFSIGEGRQYLTRYHGRVQFKKLISTWHYPDNGFTMIIGNNLSPKQILFQRQMGIMIGFVGLYIYIPKVLEYQKAGITCFAGSAMFAWGTSF